MKKLPEASYFDIVLLLFAYRTRYRVEGDSMLPLLEKGDQVLVDENAKVKVGDIVIAEHPFKENVEMVKRIKEIDKEGRYFLIGDNADESTDSRTFGSVSIQYIKGKVVARLN